MVKEAFKQRLQDVKRGALSVSAGVHPPFEGPAWEGRAVGLRSSNRREGSNYRGTVRQEASEVRRATSWIPQTTVWI